MSTPKNTTRRGRPSISKERRAAMRSEIAATTLTLFKQNGYRNISMRKIASQIGCSPMTLYKYYDSKVAILHTLWGEVFDRLEAHLDPKDQSSFSLKSLSLSYVNYWVDHPENYRLVFMTEGIEQSDVNRYLESFEMEKRYSPFLQALAESLGTSMSESELMNRLGALLCFLNGISHNLITISGYAWPKADYLVEIAVNAVTKSG